VSGAVSSSAARIGRLAPSPTGLLHLGHARTFLVAWWIARRDGARLWMRVEDLDADRSAARFIGASLEDLAWLGLDWDGEPLLQSEGLSRLNDAVDSLIERGLAYYCVCTRSDLRNSQTAPQQGDSELRYAGTCRGRFASLEAARRASGREPGVRLIVPEGAVTIEDGILGTVTNDVAREVGDFSIARRGGQPAYQLAVVVDDHAEGVTDVVRGADLLSSAARQWHVRRALGLPEPRYFHVPLVLDAEGRRLAKRADDLSLRELREGGTDPRAIVAWAAKSAGLAVADRVTPREALAAFDLALLPRAPVTLSANTLEELRGAR
jgi:glutamyl-tRNA synthetase